MRGGTSGTALGWHAAAARVLRHAAEFIANSLFEFAIGQVRDMELPNKARVGTPSIANCIPASQCWRSIGAVRSRARGCRTPSPPPRGPPAPAPSPSAARASRAPAHSPQCCGSRPDTGARAETPAHAILPAGMSAPSGATVGPRDDSAARSGDGAGAVRDDAEPSSGLLAATSNGGAADISGAREGAAMKARQITWLGVQVTPPKLSAAIASIVPPLDPPPMSWLAEPPPGSRKVPEEQRKSEQRLVSPALNTTARYLYLYLDVRIDVANSPALLGWS